MARPFAYDHTCVKFPTANLKDFQDMDIALDDDVYKKNYRIQASTVHFFFCFISFIKT